MSHPLKLTRNGNSLYQTLLAIVNLESALSCSYMDFVINYFQPNSRNVITEQ